MTKNQLRKRSALLLKGRKHKGQSVPAMSQDCVSNEPAEKLFKGKRHLYRRTAVRKFKIDAITS